MINSSYSEELYIIGFSAALGVVAALAVAACNKYTARTRSDPRISDIVNQTLSSPAPLESKKEEISQEEEERTYQRAQYGQLQDFADENSSSVHPSFSQDEPYMRSHLLQSQTYHPSFANSHENIPPSSLHIRFTNRPRLSSQGKISSYVRAILPSKITSTPEQRAEMFRKELENCKRNKTKSMISEQKLLSLPSSTEVRIWEVSNKADSFFLSLAVCLSKYRQKNGNLSFFSEAIRKDPMFLNTPEECERLQRLTRSSIPNLQSNQTMHHWVLFLRSLAGFALEDALNRVETYESVIQELKSMDVYYDDLSDSFSDQDFEILLRKVRWGDVPATPTIIRLLSQKLGKSASVFQDDERRGLVTCMKEDGVDEIGKILYHDNYYRPMEFPILVEPLSSNRFRVQTSRANMTFFAGYALAMLCSCYKNRQLVEKIKDSARLSRECLELLESVSKIESKKFFHQLLDCVLPIQMLTKEIQRISGVRSILDSSFLESLMQKTEIPIQVIQNNSTVVSPEISYGCLSWNEDCQAIYNSLT